MHLNIGGLIRREGRAARNLRMAVCGLALAAGLPAIAVAQGAPPGTPFAGPGPDNPNAVSITADTMTYDSDTQTVAARGHVWITWGERVGVADVLTYNRATRRIAASGNVALTDPTGNVLFTNRVDLTDDLDSGTIDSLEALLANGAHLSADRAIRTGGDRTEFVDAGYTPCKVCEGKSPFWRLKANTIVHDQTAHTITYHDVKLEFFGMPVLYLPYLEHPDPSVKRKTGFLSPIIGHSGNLGTSVEIPYYWSIAPNRDLTVSPVFSTREIGMLKGEYRERTASGSFTFSGSAMQERRDFDDDENVDVGRGDFRGHIFGHGKFDINSNWQWGFKVERATDDTYLRRYDFSDSNFLTSRLYLQGQQDRSFGAIDFYSFQGLRRFDKSGQTPLVLPYARYHFVGEPGRQGGYWTGDASALVLQRSDGRDTRRLSTTVGYQIPYISPLGDVYKGYFQLRGDLYDISDAQLTNAALDQTTLRSDQGGNGMTGRIRPLVGLDWRLPFTRPGTFLVQQVQPIVQLIYTPRGGNHRDIPDEDSQGFEFDDTNLFDVNRFPGVDRYEGGARANVGVEWSGYAANGASADMLFGEVFRLHENTLFSAASGLRDKRSDYVGRFTLSPIPDLDITHRFQLSKSNLGFQRNEIWLGMGPESVHLNLAYIRLAHDFTDIDPATDSDVARKELSADGRLQIFHNWILMAGTRRDLTSHGGPLQNTVGLLFHNECIELGIIFNRNYTQDRDIHPNTSVHFRFRLLSLN